MELYETNEKIVNEGAAGEELQVEYTDGSKVMRKGSRECEYNPAGGDSIVFKEGVDDRSRSHIRKAISYAELEHRSNIDIEDDTQVPISIAAEGRPTIASYLYGVEGLEIGEIAEHLGVSPRTVSQYLTDFRKGKR